MRLEAFVQELDSVTKTPNGHLARCPAHDDRKSSLSVAQGGDGKVLLKCFAGCETEQIVGALGLEMKDLFNDKGHLDPEPRIVKAYDYTDEHGDRLYQVVRFEPKDFRQRRPNGDGWTWKLDGTRRVPYRLHDLAKSKPKVLFIAEGEKDVDTLWSLGLAATCNPGGAGKWVDAYTDVLVTLLGRVKIVIFSDNDDPGRKHALQVARTWLGKAEAVKVLLALPGVPVKGDVADYLTMHSKDELVSLVKATPSLTLEKLERLEAEHDPVQSTTERHTAPPAEPSWPVLADEALHGLAGEVVAAIDPHTEADKVAVLAQFLTFFGCVVGREPHFLVEWTRHPAKLFMVLVGETSKARKGTSLSSLMRIVEAADPSIRRLSGLSSGEGLIWQVRDPIYELKQDRKTKAVEQVLVDGGEEDKRLLIQEPEFAQALKLMAREGNILSPIIRQAFDDEILSPLTKHNRITATGSHIAIIGHITKAELLRHISETEMANGFCNRFIFLVVRRSKCLPNPKGLSLEQVEGLAKKLRKRIEQAHTTAARGPLTREEDAETSWAEVYPSLSDGTPGLTGAILGRGECHVMRLALTYALLDGATQIKTPHLKAAIALWDYAEASAQYIFGDATGDAVADRIVSALRTQGAMSETDISGLFGGNKKASQIHQALHMLNRVGMIVSEVVKTDGRQKTVWRVTK